MTSKQPPGIATWLLQHFGSGPNNDAVLGDLAEQYLQKNSAMWYWRQAMKASPVSLVKEIQGHKWIAARALLIGWGMWTLCGSRVQYQDISISFPGDFFFGASGVMWNPAYPGGGMPVFKFAFPLIVGAICGWLVGRFHRDQQTTVVLLFAGSILLMDLLLFVQFFLFGAFHTAYAFIGPVAANYAASFLGILLGGGLLHDRTKTVSR